MNLAPHYTSYLMLTQLLSLQSPLAQPTAHDELAFIVVHQIHELAFKLLIHELNKIKKNFINHETHEAMATFNRCKIIVYSLNSQLQVLETMQPTHFIEFRSFLGRASGHQSVQFHKINKLLGLETESDVSIEKQKVITLIDAFTIFLKHLAKRLNLTEFSPSALLTYLYKKNSKFCNLFETMIDFDIALQTWRYHHVKLAERMIGTKSGTGGTTGVEYLAKSIHQKIFPLLWEVRNFF